MSPDLLLTSDLILRPPTAADESAFVDLRALSGHQARHAQGEFQRLLASPAMQTLLLETKSGPALIGYLDWTEPNNPFLEVAPNRRLRGYASQALDRVSRFRQDLSDLCIEIEADNTTARLLLEKCGYQCLSGPQDPTVQYTAVSGPQRRLLLDLLDSQYRQAVHNQVRAIHQDLSIAADYGHVHQLELTVEARQLSSIGNDVYGRRQHLKPAAAAAWQALVQAATADGQSLQPVSAYRSISYQESIIRRKLDAGATISEILKVSAAPGYSEHHSGRAVDITTPGCEILTEEFDRTSAYAWLDNNGDDFGFHLSYPPNNHNQIAYEPWHWAYTNT